MTLSSFRLSSIVVFLCLGAVSASSAELVVLSPNTWDEYAPHGKEADAIYGDFVLRNDRIVAVIAKPVQGRNANMTARGAGGALIDLTLRDHQSDQLTALYPGGLPGYRFQFSAVTGDKKEFNKGDKFEKRALRAKVVSLRLHTKSRRDKPSLTLEYSLKDGDPYVTVRSVYTNDANGTLTFDAKDTLRADLSRDKLSPERIGGGETSLFWFYDKWFGQAYGIVREGATIDVKESTGSSRYDPLDLVYPSGGGTQFLDSGQSVSITRYIFPGRNMLDVRAIAAALAGESQLPVSVLVMTPARAKIPQADVLIKKGDEDYAWGRTDADGAIEFTLPQGNYETSISALGYSATTLKIAPQQQAVYNVVLKEPGAVTARIVDNEGEFIPAKVQFFGRDGVDDPFFGPNSGEHGVHNAYYTENGQFTQVLPPGKYDVIVSYGPEYDAAFTEIDIKRGAQTPLTVTLNRVVSTPRWISSDFHSHSSPSGDNTSSQRGRVLNLLAEHIEFAPCTEHNRINSYTPLLKELKAEHIMATCTGMELTSSPGSLNHHNAFPLIHKPHTQDGGAPSLAPTPEIQIARLALWDDESDKLVQQNHPDIPRLFFDRDNDGEPDDGLEKAVGYMDVIEVHPPAAIFKDPYTGPQSSSPTRTRIFSWMQTLNQGHRIPGVVNTDAHANFHGSGWLRNYIQSSTDDPSKIDTMEMVHAAERGNVIMTNGPYLEVTVRSEETSGKTWAIAGEDLRASNGRVAVHIRVQCANWLDVDRVQIFVNGVAQPDLNYTRASHPNYFSHDVIKFERVIPLSLDGDAHIIVATIDEDGRLGPVAGPRHANDKPSAVANPIFVDVDGGGFSANGDTLGAALVSPG